MGDKVTIREAARRLGVSDTAVHKAIKAGRITPPIYTDTKRAYFPDFAVVEAQFTTNTSAQNRSHVGARGSARRANDEPTKLQVSARMDEPITDQPSRASQPKPVIDDVSGDNEQEATAPRQQQAGGNAPTYAQSRAVREAYAARLSKLEYEERIGKLINADEVKFAWYKHITAAKTRIMGIPAACKMRYADLPLSAIAIIEQVCREALEDLADGKH